MGTLDIQYELYNININSDNITNLDDKKRENQNMIQILLSSAIEYLPIIITRYSNILPNQIIPLLDKNKCNTDLSYEFMKKTYWLEYLSKQTLEKEIDPARNNILKWLKNKSINQDYYLAIVYYSSKRLVIGIFIMNIDMLDIKLDSFNIETIILLSKVNTNTKSDTNSDTNFFNIFQGILQYYNNLQKELGKKQLKMQNSIETLLDKKLIKQDVITWKMVLMNCSNYLPRLEILVKEKKVTSFFQNRLNP